MQRALNSHQSQLNRSHCTANNAYSSPTYSTFIFVAQICYISITKPLLLSSHKSWIFFDSTSVPFFSYLFQILSRQKWEQGNFLEAFLIQFHLLNANCIFSWFFGPVPHQVSAVYSVNQFTFCLQSFHCSCKPVTRKIKIGYDFFPSSTGSIKYATESENILHIMRTKNKSIATESHFQISEWTIKHEKIPQLGVVEF